jgi:Na+/melibiose symporter-like transporter
MIFCVVFILVFLICYFFIKELNNSTLNENSKYSLKSNNFETILDNIKNISEDTTSNKKEFLKQKQGNANANW